MNYNSLKMCCFTYLYFLYGIKKTKLCIFKKHVVVVLIEFWLKEVFDYRSSFLLNISCLRMQSSRKFSIMVLVLLFIQLYLLNYKTISVNMFNLPLIGC